MKSRFAESKNAPLPPQNSRSPGRYSRWSTHMQGANILCTEPSFICCLQDAFGIRATEQIKASWIWQLIKHENCKTECKITVTDNWCELQLIRFAPCSFPVDPFDNFSIATCELIIITTGTFTSRCWHDVITSLRCSYVWRTVCVCVCVYIFFRIIIAAIMYLSTWGAVIVEQLKALLLVNKFPIIRNRRFIIIFSVHYA
jgi:hypothetical protein